MLEQISAKKYLRKLTNAKKSGNARTAAPKTETDLLQLQLMA